MRTIRVSIVRTLIPCALLLSVAGCGGDDGPKGDPDGGSPTEDAAPSADADTSTGDSVLDSLTDLGIDVDMSPRIDSSGNALPATYAPFGDNLEVGRIDEFLFLANAGISRIVDFDRQSPSVLLSLDDSPEPWISEDNTAEKFPQSTRAAGALDIDGDGRDETIIVYVDLNDPAANMQLKAHIIDDEIDGFTATTQVLDLRPNIADINIGTGDINGDGLDDLIVGLSNGAQGSLLVFENNAGQLTLNAASEVTFAEEVASTEKSFRIVTGNLDYDRALETAVVLNEQRGTSVATGGSRYAVFDDLGAGFTQLDAGPITVSDNGVFQVVAGDVSIGDVDGDHLDEVVLGGVGDLQQSCNSKPLLLRVLDDRTHSLALLGQQNIDYLPLCSVSGPKIRFAPVNTPDVDGDGIDEISIFTMVVSNFTAANPFERISAFTIPEQAVYDGDRFLDRNVYTIVEGYAHGDGKQDLLVWSQQGQADEIAVWGNDDVQGWGELQTMPGPSSSGAISAQIIPMNIDNDTAVLKYVEAGQQFVFTSPIVIAALAAPPCYAGIGQFELGCFTTFGNETSNTVSEEQVISMTASASVGFKIGNDAAQTELALKATATATANSIKGSGYSYTSSIVYTTGTQEDAVIFTTVPQDQYTYAVVSHPDPTLIGKEIVVSLPRSTITLMVEREFYNSHVPDGAPQIDSSVFEHTIGDVASYPSVAEKDTILSATEGLQTPAQSVGQGGGTVEIGLSVGTELSEGNALAMGWQADVETTLGGLVHGFSVGASVSNSLTVTSGDLSSYTGSIGSLPADQFADNQYSYGLFTYVHEDPTTLQQYEVVNYWVE